MNKWLIAIALGAVIVFFTMRRRAGASSPSNGAGAGNGMRNGNGGTIMPPPVGTPNPDAATFEAPTFVKATSEPVATQGTQQMASRTATSVFRPPLMQPEPLFTKAVASIRSIPTVRL